MDASNEGRDWSATGRVFLNDLPAAEIHARLAQAGVTARTARRLQAAALREGAVPAALPEVSHRVLDRVRELAAVPHLERLEKVVSARDGFARYLFRGAEAEPFEAVCIPLVHRDDDRKCVVCVSSQVGCALGCAFCCTGRMGLVRNLAAWEMVDQVAAIRADAELPVRGVVFMGMGEPLLNYEAVMRAAGIMAAPCGLAIAAKAISISTAGIVPGIAHFTADRQPYRLVVTLAAADSARRRALMPIEERHPLPQLIAALRDHQAAMGGRVTLAWPMISGYNTREDDARQLAALVQGLPVKIDLIDVNDPSGRFQPPAADELAAFRDALRHHQGAPVARRYSGGADIQAACGLLGLARRPRRHDPAG